MPIESVFTIESIRRIDYKVAHAPGRILVPIEAGSDAPFIVARIFTVHAEIAGLTGGGHAHRQCTQLISALSGTITLNCRTPNASRAFELDAPHQAVLVPPGLWAEQVYHQAGAILQVLCDRVFEEEDYLRDFSAYQTWIAAHG